MADDSKEARLAAALRANLKRRKTQAREREVETPTPSDRPGLRT